MDELDLEAVMAVIAKTIQDFDEWEFYETPMSLDLWQFDSEASKKALIAAIQDELGLK